MCARENRHTSKDTGRCPQRALTEGHSISTSVPALHLNRGPLHLQRLPTRLALQAFASRLLDNCARQTCAGKRPTRRRSCAFTARGKPAPTAGDAQCRSSAACPAAGKLASLSDSRPPPVGESAKSRPIRANLLDVQLVRGPSHSAHRRRVKHSERTPCEATNRNFWGTERGMKSWKML